MGGTGIKSVILDGSGRPVSTRKREPTPQPATPKAILKVILAMTAGEPTFDRVGLGFPGVVKHGVVETAPHLDPKWEGVDLQKELTKVLSKPARVANDAVVQGYAAISGKGVELVITLGTGMGAAGYANGQVIPMEIGHHPLHHDLTYDQRIGNVAFKEIGKHKWNKRVKEALEQLRKTFNYDDLYVGGGNAKKITFALPKNARVIDNQDGMLGVMALWRD